MDHRHLEKAKTAVRVDYPLALASGFLATLTMTTVSYLMLPLLGWSQVDVPIWAARIVTTDRMAVAELGIMMHLLIGLGFACVFARAVEPKLRLSPSMAGVVYGLALWALAQAVAVPVLGALAIAQGEGPASSPGWFAARLGIGPAVFSLAAHLAYGLALSLVYGRECSTPEGRPTRVWTEQAAAAGGPRLG